MSIKSTIQAIKALGLSCSYNSEAQEYRVNYKMGKESTAYYTNDSHDAIGTAKEMIKPILLNTGETY